MTITHVGGDRGFRRRLMELGVLPGTDVRLTSIAPLGDPLQLQVRGCSLSIRRAEAAQVAVSSAPQRVAVSEKPRLAQPSACARCTP